LEDASFNPSGKVDLMPSLVSAYPKRFGVLRNRQVARDIAKLDPRADCERIVHLLSSYEFGFDIARVLELALFRRPKWTVKPVVRALIRDDLREAFGYAPAPDALKLVLPPILTLRASIKKYLHIERTPRSILNTRNRTYPGNQYVIEGIKPSYDK
jgi:hypothetical protein